MKAYINGHLQEAAGNDIFEPGFLFGWGVFEPLRVYAGKPAFLDAHLSRLANSCRLLSLELPKIEWQVELDRLLQENKLTDAYVRLTVYKKRKDTGVLIYVDDFRYYVPTAYDNGFTTGISTIRRDENDISCKVKAISYLNNRLAWHEAAGKGKDEALMLNLKGDLAGGSRSNIFLVNDNKVITPRLEDGAFCGITRQVVIDILRDMHFEVSEQVTREQDIYSAQEVFITSSLLEVMPIVGCGNQATGCGKPGPVAVKIRQEYHRRINE